MTREYGTGSITRLEDKPRNRCRKWRLRYRGKTRRFTGTYAEAKAALETFRAEVDSDTGNAPVTFRQYADSWATQRERSGNYRDSTCERVRNCIKALDSAFGNLAMEDVNRSEIASRFAKMRSGSNPSGKPLTGNYCQSLWSVLKQIVTSARIDGIVDGDPFLGLKAPKANRTGRRALDTGELLAFVAQLDSEPPTAHRVAVRLALMCGLRRGEICGLVWSDFGGDVLHVSRSVDESGNPTPTKTYAGVRKVPVPESVTSVLMEWRDIQRMMFEADEITQDENTPICAAKNGNYMHPQNLASWWREHRASYGLPDIVLHELRHTYLTYLAHASKDMSAVQHIAGWSSPEMARVYVHGSLEAERAAVDSLGW